MRYRNFIGLSGLILAILVFVSPCLAQDKSDDQKLEEARIERRIRKEILSLPYYGVFDAIGFEFDGRTVTLEGYVIRPSTKKEAGAAIGDIPGISKVDNKIKVLPPSPSDDRIRLRIYREIQNKGNLYRYLLGANPAIRIIVNAGRVTLEGVVVYKSDKTLAEVAATEVFGVLSVTNNLQLERREGEELA